MLRVYRRHLRLGLTLPLDEVVGWFGELILVERLPRKDEMAVLLGDVRAVEAKESTEHRLGQACSGAFDLMRCEPPAYSNRALYLWRRSSGRLGPSRSEAQ